MEWTKYILKLSEEDHKTNPMQEGCRLGEHLINGEEKLRYRAEDAKIDLALGKDNFKGLKKISSNVELNNDECFYPKVYEVIVEHENNIDTAWQEMIKLTSFRAKLKVLITYNYAEEVDQEYHKHIKSLEENFQKIIEQTNQVLPEPPDTEYLLIIGQRKESKEDKIQLKFFTKIFSPCNPTVQSDVFELEN